MILYWAAFRVPLGPFSLWADVPGQYRIYLGNLSLASDSWSAGSFKLVDKVTGPEAYVASVEGLCLFLSPTSSPTRLTLVAPQ